jgi:hypothetical protein
MEKIILKEIQRQVRLSDSLQFAYKKGYSTLDAAAFLVHSVASELDKKGGIFRLAFLDYSNAFGSLDRGKLLHDLLDMGLDPKLFNLLTDYFSGRSQFISCNGKTSSHLPVNRGVLQGSILSPFLFACYVSQFPTGQISFTSKYADDIAIGFHQMSHPSNDMLQSCLSSVTDWSTERSLSLNAGKCVSVAFSLRRGSSYARLGQALPQLSVAEEPIPCSTTVKYLGLTLSQNLDWTPHVSNVFSRVRRLSFYCIRLRKLSVPHALIRNFVFQCILPHWLYLSPVFFPGLKSSDFVLIRRSLKFLAKSCNFDTSTLVHFIVDKHKDACFRLLEKILKCSDHPLHPFLSQAISTSNTRAPFKLLYTRTETFRRTLIPYLARLLVDRDAVLNNLRDNLLL